jgi:hypothetical protein
MATSILTLHLTILPWQSLGSVLGLARRDCSSASHFIKYCSKARGWSPDVQMEMRIVASDPAILYFEVCSPDPITRPVRGRFADTYPISIDEAMKPGVPSNHG